MTEVVVLDLGDPTHLPAIIARGHTAQTCQAIDGADTVNTAVRLYARATFEVAQRGPDHVEALGEALMRRIAAQVDPEPTTPED